MHGTRHWIFAVFAMCACYGFAAGPGDITFAQLTDAHIFDDGYKKPTADAMKQAANDREALHWAIDQVNSAVASGTKVDFVVYTGDLGLQNVAFPADGSCYALPLTLYPGVPPVPLPWAVQEFADELNRLQLGTVLLLPGNNDIEDENVTDRRFECFTAALQQRAATFARKLEVKALTPERSVDINGVRIAGLNTASFKAMKNYQQACASGPYPPGCPDSQMKALHALASANTASPLLLFTHEPDLIDPYFHQNNPAVRKSVWDISSSVRSEWEAEVCGANVLAVFAGHFHDSDRTVYGSNTGTAPLAYTPCVAKKTWVAPPLALKNQETSKTTARGLLLVTIAGGKVTKVDPKWFPNSPPPVPPAAPSSAPPPRSPGDYMLWWVLGGIGIVFLFLTVTTFLTRSRDLNAAAAAVGFVLLACGIVWLCRTQLDVTDSATIAAILVCPLIVYGIVSGRITEFSGLGWGAKFGQAANAPVDAGKSAVDYAPNQAVPKEGLVETLQKLSEASPDEPIVLTLDLGGPGRVRSYNSGDLGEVLRQAIGKSNFRFVVFQNPERQVVSYIPGELLLRDMETDSGRAANLLAAANTGREEGVVKAHPRMRTETISFRASNAEALEKLNDLGVDAIPVVDAQGHLRGIAERNRILARMFQLMAKK